MLAPVGYTPYRGSSAHTATNARHATASCQLRRRPPSTDVCVPTSPVILALAPATSATGSASAPHPIRCTEPRSHKAAKTTGYHCAATAPIPSFLSSTPSAPTSRLQRGRIRSTELANPPYPPLRPAHIAQPPELRCPALHPGSPGPYASLAYAPCQPPPMSSDSKPARAITPW